MFKYAKKTDAVDAVLFSGEVNDDIILFFVYLKNEIKLVDFIQQEKKLIVKIPTGEIEVFENEYLIKGLDGKFYTQKKKEFNSLHYGLNVNDLLMRILKNQNKINSMERLMDFYKSEKFKKFQETITPFFTNKGDK